MLHSPLFSVWIGWVLVVGGIVVVRGVYARRENAELERRRMRTATFHHSLHLSGLGLVFLPPLDAGHFTA